MKKQFSESAEIFRWGPIPGKFFYISDFWDVIFVEYPKKYPKYAWPKTLILFKEGRMVWLNDFQELREMGSTVFMDCMLPNMKRKKLVSEWRVRIKALSEIEQKICSTNLGSLSDNQLFKLANIFLRKLYDFWLPTVIFELGNYGSVEMLESKIKKLIAEDLSRLRAMEILCSPEKLSFYQEEELDLLKTENIKRHAGKYFWLKNSYNGVDILTQDFFQKRKLKINKNLASELNQKIKLAKRVKKELAIKHKLPKEIIDFAKALTEGIELQDERKKHIFISLHFKDIFLREIARRKNIDVEELYKLDLKEIFIATSQDSYNRKIKNRSRSFGFFAEAKGRLVETIHNESEKYWNDYVLEKGIENSGFVKGVIASPGKNKIIQARVRILLDPSKSNSLRKGEILIAPMTSPEYIFAIKKASAVITDSGGLTSHAAIVTRELNKPCLVGTKFATQIFQDGDLVEINTNTGVAKIIK